MLEKERRWKWNSECEQAFLKAKELIASEKVPAHYDPQRPIKLECDASPYVLGADLTQVMDHVIILNDQQLMLQGPLQKLKNIILR